MAWHDNSNHLLHSIARMHYSSWYRVSYRDVFAQLGLRAQPKNFNLNLRPFHNIMNIEINLIGLKTAACHAKKCVSIHDTRLKRHIALNSGKAMIKNHCFTSFPIKLCTLCVKPCQSSHRPINLKEATL